MVLQTPNLAVSRPMRLAAAPKVNQLLKSIYYSFSHYSLSQFEELNLGYVFHTERIYNDTYFSRLLRFCKSYEALTGKKAICTLMPFTNARVAHECRSHNVDDKNYLERTRELSTVSSLGYHGHFWTDPTRLSDTSTEIKKENFSHLAFRKQFEEDLHWFKRNDISHNGVYAAGWWFMNREVLLSLLENQFTVDFSFSQSKWFSNPYSEKSMRENRILAGESFLVSHGEHKLLCVQNLIGCHHSSFPEDFVRNLLKLNFSKETNKAMGVVNSHDDDLDENNTLGCIEYLMKQPKVTFWGLEEFKKESLLKSTKCVALDSNK